MLLSVDNVDGHVKITVRVSKVWLPWKRQPRLLARASGGPKKRWPLTFEM